jgi:tRNA G10  N-methylase Trm11
MKNQEIKNLYAFTLGREWKLSLAELLAIFGIHTYRWNSETVALLSIEDTNSSELSLLFRKIGGSVRVIEILDETDERRFATDVINYLQDSKTKKKNEEWENTRTKVTFALGAYSIEFRLSDIGLRIKKTLQENGKSARLVNTENENINAASFKKERLSKSQTEFNIISIGNTIYIGRTLVCQDIDAYSHRDTAKSRDMIVGMMPPKLAQILINLALDWKNNSLSVESWSFSNICVYDPFCGLGTTLIEAANMGITKLLGSDLSPQMVRSTRESLDTFVAEEKMWQERIITAWWKPNKDFSSMHYDIFELDAMKIFRHFEGKKIENTVIVSEWYLGAIMQKESITIDRVKSERMSLMRMYDAFFRGLKNLGFKWNIVMTFPFWDIRGNCSYFTEIYDVLEDAGYQIIPLLPHTTADLLTKKWSLLYQRPGQNVGREVIKIQLKK